jgi:hypothetical protein
MTDREILKRINNLVDNDFVFDMECKLIPKVKKYTQEEAQKMADLLGGVYMLSHTIHCKACREHLK